MPTILIDRMEQSNRSANVTTSGFFYLVDSIDTNFNVTGRQTNASDPAAGSGPSAGERWIVEDVSDVSGYFTAGLPGAAEDNDIVEYDGSAWSLIVDVDNAKTNEGHLVYVEDENLFYFYNGTSWGELGGGTYTAGDGLDLSGTSFSADLKPNGGLVIDSTEIAVDLGASSITGTLAVGDGGTGLTSLATLLNSNVTPATLGLVIGTNVQAYDADLGQIAGLTRTRGDLIVGGASAWTDLGIGAANTVLTTNGTDPAWTTVTNAMLANSSVSYGGVSLSLGVTDATPAFDLIHATNYPTSSLTGNITNAQLAGGIVNAKLANSTVTVGTTSIALGASSTTLAGLTSVTVDGGAGLRLRNGDTTAGFANFYEATEDSINSVKLIGPASTTGKTITLPDTTGTVVTTGDTDTVTSTMIAPTLYSHSGTTNDGVLTRADGNGANVEANLQFDGTTLKVGSAAYGGDVDGLVISAPPPFTVNNGTIDTLTIESGGRITTNSGIRAFGTTYQLGPKGGGTTNFISNEGVKTTLSANIGTGEGASGNVATVASTDGMKVGDAVFITSVNSNADNTANGAAAGTSSEFEIASVNSVANQFTVTATNFYVAGTGPSYPISPPAPGWYGSGSWVDVLGTGNLNFRNANVNEDPSGVARDLQFDYANGSLGRDGGSLKFRSRRRRTVSGGSETTNLERLIIDKDGKTTFNPSCEATADFCVEGDTDTALLYVDASTDRVGISTPSPRHMLDVRGSYGGAATGPKAVEYTLSATDFMVFVTAHASNTYDITTPAVYAEGRIIYIVCDSGGTGTGKHQIVANSGQTILYDTTADDSVFQLSKVGQMITLIGTRTADTWVCVKTGHQPHTHTATVGTIPSNLLDHHSVGGSTAGDPGLIDDHTVTIGTT